MKKQSCFLIEVVLVHKCLIIIGMLEASHFTSGCDTLAKR